MDKNDIRLGLHSRFREIVKPPAVPVPALRIHSSSDRPLEEHRTPWRSPCLKIISSVSNLDTSYSFLIFLDVRLHILLCYGQVITVPLILTLPGSAWLLLAASAIVACSFCRWASITWKTFVSTPGKPRKGQWFLISYSNVRQASFLRIIPSKMKKTVHRFLYEYYCVKFRDKRIVSERFRELRKFFPQELRKKVILTLLAEQQLREALIVDGLVWRRATGRHWNDCGSWY